MNLSTPSQTTQLCDELIARIRSDVALLREMAIDPVDIPYGENISFEIRPKVEGDTLNVYRKDWGTTCVNYTGEGLILDVFSEGALDSLHTTSIESAELMDPDVQEQELADASGGSVAEHKLQVLTAVGYDISEGSDQKGLWTWRFASTGFGCDSSLDTQDKAIDEAWMDAGHRVSMAEEISWNGRTLLQQVDLIKQVLGSGADDSTSPVPAPTGT